MDKFGIASFNSLSKRDRDRIEEVSDERGSGDGIWIYLKPGWKSTWSETHAIHEYTVKDCLDAMRTTVKVCGCQECKDIVTKNVLNNLTDNVGYNVLVQK